MIRSARRLLLCATLISVTALQQVEAQPAQTFKMAVSGLCGTFANDISASDDLFPCNACAQSDQGLAQVFARGAEHSTTLTPVCLNNLGIYNPETGARTATNFSLNPRGYLLNGKFLQTNVESQAPVVARFLSPNNNFSVNPSGTADANARQSTIAASEVHLYYYVNDYRNRFITSSFVSSLGLAADRAANLTRRQFRPDLDGIVNARLPNLIASEQTAATAWSSSVAQNNLRAPARQRNFLAADLDSLAFDPEFVIAEYSGVVANWISAGTAQWPTDANFGAIGNLGWRTDIRPAILAGFKLWNAHHYSTQAQVGTGEKELFKYASRVQRRWGSVACGGNNQAPCNKGRRIDNAMMYLDTADAGTNYPGNPSWPGTASDDSLLFPYFVRGGVPPGDIGPRGAELAGMFVAGLFYDIANEVGLGYDKTNRLFWKTISLIDPGQPISMTTFAQRIQQAARALFPTTANPALSWYEQDLVDVLSSRGIRVNGAANFLDNLPLPLGVAGNQGPGNSTVLNAAGFGSSVPETQRNSSTGYNFLSFFTNGYTVTTPGTQYVTYQFYKYSRYGACDSLDLTNGTVSTVNSNNPVLEYNGTMAARYGERSLGNMLLMAPGTTINFLRHRQSCVSEREGHYSEDVRPLGFRVLKAIPNGFTFRVVKTGGAVAGRTRYTLTIVDPSLTLSGANTGPATFNWRFTEFNGAVVQATGQQVNYDALRDQPFTLYVERIRGAQNDNLTLRENGNFLDRTSGKQFNQDFWNPGYRVGFDTVRDRRLVEGHGSYNSALNPVGGAFGVQGRRWTTPNSRVQPLTFSTVSHGLGSGSNQNGPYRFADAVYYNACIWGNRGAVTQFPGCSNDNLNGNFEVQVPFSQVGINLAEPFATVTAGGYPGYLWTVNYPAHFRLDANREYYFGSHISASVVNNGYSYNVCSYNAASGTAGNADDRSDWLAGANWSGQSGAPPPQTMRSYLGSPGSVANCTYAAYRFEGVTVP